MKEVCTLWFWQANLGHDSPAHFLGAYGSYELGEKALMRAIRAREKSFSWPFNEGSDGEIYLTRTELDYDEFSSEV